MKEWMGPLLTAVEESMTDALSLKEGDLYTPVEYILDLGGKRMRPVVALLGCELYQDDWKPAIPAATALEVFHNFTLVHDDIMDEAPLRRGQATVHEKWNASQAILSGDAMLVLAYEILRDSPPLRLPELLALFGKTALEVCEGQQLDMDFEKRSDVSVDEYLDMIRLKTSVLLAASLQMGAIVGGASKSDQEHIYQFGLNLGLAFQLRDDYLDAFGNSETFGKQVGGDILSDKKTYLLIRAFEKAGAAEKQILDRYIGSGETNGKVSAVKDVMTTLEVPAELQELSDQYYEKAVQALDEVSVSDERKAKLRALAAWLMQRDS